MLTLTWVNTLLTVGSQPVPIRGVAEAPDRPEVIGWSYSPNNQTPSVDPGLGDD